MYVLLMENVNSNPKNPLGLRYGSFCKYLTEKLLKGIGINNLYEETDRFLAGNDRRKYELLRKSRERLRKILSRFGHHPFRRAHADRRLRQSSVQEISLPGAKALAVSWRNA